jgi:uncharacterized protein RhaS with RHS repeats
MTFQWDEVKLDVAVLKGDQCERQFTLTRSVDHYFVNDDRKGTVRAFFDTAR